MYACDQASTTFWDRLNIKVRVGSLLFDVLINDNIVPRPLQYVQEKHNHAAFELQFIWSGSGTLIFDETERRLESGSIHLIGPNIFHAVNPDENDPVVRSTFRFTFREDKESDPWFPLTEAEQLEAVLSGYTEAGANGEISGTQAFEGTKSLRVYDTSSSVLTNVVKTTTASSAKVLQAKVYPVTGSNIISINSGGNDNSDSVFHVGILSDGSLQYYNGSSWNMIAAAGTVSRNAWHTIAIEAYNTTNANVFLDGAYQGAAGKWNTSSTMDRVRFMSGGASGTGDDFYVDNVSFN